TVSAPRVGVAEASPCLLRSGTLRKCSARHSRPSFTATVSHAAGITCISRPRPARDEVVRAGKAVGTSPEQDVCPLRRVGLSRGHVSKCGPRVVDDGSSAPHDAWRCAYPLFLWPAKEAPWSDTPHCKHLPSP